MTHRTGALRAMLAAVTVALGASSAAHAQSLDPVWDSHSQTIIQTQQTTENLFSPFGADLPADPHLATKCGLSGNYAGGAGPGRYYFYKIKNCHGYKVKRRVEVNNHYDGACHTIGKNQTADGYFWVPYYGSVKGLIAC